MNLSIHLDAETEARLRDEAQRLGKDLEAVALDALHEHLAASGEPPAPSSLADWRVRLDAMLRSLPRVAVDVDDRRETIYEGRGQ
jgi:hypothetical protein